MSDIVVGEVVSIIDQTIHFACYDYYEERSYSTKRPLSFMDDQGEYLIVGDIVEFVQHPENPVRQGMGRIRLRDVPNRFSEILRHIREPGENRARTHQRAIG